MTPSRSGPMDIRWKDSLTTWTVSTRVKLVDTSGSQATAVGNSPLRSSRCSAFQPFKSTTLNHISNMLSKHNVNLMATSEGRLPASSAHEGWQRLQDNGHAQDLLRVEVCAEQNCCANETEIKQNDCHNHLYHPNISQWNLRRPVSSQPKKSRTRAILGGSYWTPPLEQEHRGWPLPKEFSEAFITSWRHTWNFFQRIWCNLVLTH